MKIDDDADAGDDDDDDDGKTTRGDQMCMTHFGAMLQMEYKNAERILVAEQRVIQTVGYDDEDDDDEGIM